MAVLEVSGHPEENQVHRGGVQSIGGALVEEGVEQKTKHIRIRWGRRKIKDHRSEEYCGESGIRI